LLGEHYNAEESPVDPWIIDIFNLYVRCRKLKDLALPKAGGIFDQEDLMLRQLEIIHDVVQQHEKELHEDMIRRVEQKSRVQAASSNLSSRP
jgi:hypothetical protein